MKIALPNDFLERVALVTRLQLRLRTDARLRLACLVEIAATRYARRSLAGRAFPGWSLGTSKQGILFQWYSEFFAKACSRATISAFASGNSYCSKSRSGTQRNGSRGGRFGSLGRQA